MAAIMTGATRIKIIRMIAGRVSSQACRACALLRRRALGAGSLTTAGVGMARSDTGGDPRFGMLQRALDRNAFAGLIEQQGGAVVEVKRKLVAKG